MKRTLMFVMMLMLVSLGFAQTEPNSSTPPATEQVQATTTTTTATATATSTTPAPTAPETKMVTVDAVFEGDIAFSALLQGGRTTSLYRSKRALTREESAFLETVPAQDGMGMRLRDAVEALFLNSDDPRDSTLHPPSVVENGRVRFLTYQEAYKLGLINSQHIWTVNQPSDADQNVEGRIQETIHVRLVGKVTIPVPVIPGPAGDPGRPGETVYVQPPPAPVCVQQQAPAQCYVPPPPPPQRVIYYTVPKDPYGSPVVAQNNGCNQQSAYIPQYNAWDRLGQVLLPFALKPEPNNWNWSTVISNGSSSNSNATNNNSNTAYGGAGGAGGQGGQGGFAWQNQGQGQYQGQTSWNNNQNQLNNENNWNNANWNQLNGGDQTTGVGVTTNTGVAVH